MTAPLGFCVSLDVEFRSWPGRRGILVMATNGQPFNARDQHRMRHALDSLDALPPPVRP